MSYGMRVISRTLRCIVSAFVIGSILGGAALAQEYPSKPIHLVVPLGAGSSTDILSRLVAAAVTEETGQPIVVENKTGAEGVLGARFVAAAPADGYTIMVTTSSTQVINVHLYKNLAYDPIKDFVAVTPLVTLPLMLWVNTSSPMNSVDDVIKRAKQAPGKLTFGSSTTTMRLSGEMFKQKSGVQMLNVPYRTTAAAVTDLASGVIDIVFTDLASAAAQRQAGKVKPLAAMVKKRVDSLPNVPTIAEAGVTGYDLGVFFGVWAPANTPAAIVTRLNALITNAMKTKRLQDLLTKIGAEPLLMSPDEFRRFHISEIEKLGLVVKAAGIEPQ